MHKEKGMLLAAMGIFGTVGLFVRYIPLPSAAIALSRAMLGLLFLCVLMAITGKRPDKTAIRKNLLLLLFSGMAMGLNWLLLFESYRYTTVATATVCYYFAPVLLLLLSPLLGEKLSVQKLLCVLVALGGIVCISGVLRDAPPQPKELLGIAFGLGAAVLYASVMFLNKKLPPMASYDKTIFQLAGSLLVLLPYLLLTESLSDFSLTGLQWGLLAVMGILHTGIAYALYFRSLEKLSAKTISVLCYLDPVIAVVLSAVFLREPLTPLGIFGTVLVLGSALYSELPKQQKST